jgi:hypothetical protein
MLPKSFTKVVAGPAPPPGTHHRPPGIPHGASPWSHRWDTWSLQLYPSPLWGDIHIGQIPVFTHNWEMAVHFNGKCVFCQSHDPSSPCWQISEPLSPRPESASASGLSWYICRAWMWGCEAARLRDGVQPDQYAPHSTPLPEPRVSQDLPQQSTLQLSLYFHRAPSESPPVVFQLK